MQKGHYFILPGVGLQLNNNSMNRNHYNNLLALLCLLSSTLTAQEVIRGPYLQAVCQEGINVRWRTNTATNSKVWYGNTPDDLSQIVESTINTTEHEVALNGLEPNTTYFYAIGNTNGQLEGGTEAYYFNTSPMPETGEPITIWALGDAGRKNANQRAVRDAYYNYHGNSPIDLLLTMGDNAYTDGTDSEFQDAWFENMYEDRLINTPLFMTYGNHDGGAADGEDGTGVYFDIFTMPVDGSCGGVASENESYYSFDYGDVHCISINSWDVDRSPDSPMVQWLEEDLAANDRIWTIVNFHHPVYDGRNDIDSDNKSLNVELRESVVPLFDQYGVDLVLMGHSHTYQRSYLVDGHYGMSPTFDPVTMGINMGDGQVDGDGPYQKVDGKGIVYVISGTAGTVNSVDNLNHPVMYHNSLTLGSFIVDINHNQLDAKFLTEDGIIDDYFTITKDIPPVQLVNITNPLQGFTSPQSTIITTDVGEQVSSVTDVEFFINESSIGVDQTFPFTMNHTFAEEGAYDIEITANTNFGIYKDSVHIVIGDQMYPPDTDGDGTLDDDDICDGMLEPGTICNDNNTATYDDVITENCICEGTPYDCSVLLTNIGTPCDDNDPATYDDIVNGNCDCAGIPFDCPDLLANAGTPCDDNNPNTFEEILTVDCQCQGITVSNIITTTVLLQQSSDDAEEAADGSMSLSSSDLELVRESSNQTIGLHYASANIPEGAYIIAAYLQFTVDEIDTENTILNIWGELSTDGATFVSVNENITNRPKTSNSATWGVPGWLDIDNKGEFQRSPELNFIIQEIIEQPNYTSETPITFIINGSGKRVAQSKDKHLSNGPELVLTYGFPCIDADEDGICDSDDLCPDSPGSIGDSCDDGNSATTNDIYNENCECVGTAYDCPVAEANIGSSCDDNNPGTYDDVVDENCNCTGTAFDCPILMADIGASCDDNNDSTYNDLIDGNCNCVGITYDCEVLQANIGTACNDNNNNTTNDVITNNCECEGELITGTITISAKVASGSDDAEEKVNGSVSLNSTDLEMVMENTMQTVGVRFTNLSIPENITIVSAYIQFTTDEAVNQNPSTLTIYGEANANPSTFVKETTNITSRAKTTAYANWEPEEWNQVGTQSGLQRTADLSLIIQELIEQPDYLPGNPIAFLIEGTGRRVAESYNGSVDNAPELVITYSNNLQNFDCPALSLNIGDFCDDNDTSTTNDVVTSNCECLGTVTFDCPSLSLNVGDFCNDNNASTGNDVVTTDCECIGTAVVDCPALSLNVGDACNDNNASTTNDIVTSDCECQGETIPPSSNTISIPISDLNDDAEEKLSSGIVRTNSSDLELAEDKGVEQLIGIRFANPNLPLGAHVENAYIQFTSEDNENVNPCQLNIYGELSANSVAFTPNNHNISNRMKTVSTVIWNPEEEWSEGDNGIQQRTTNIAGIIQEIINLPNYEYNNALTILIDGVGMRAAESFDGNSNAAAELIITYSSNCPDSDNDGICNSADPCPDLAGVPGDSCNDNNPETINDSVQSDCSCAGEIPDGFACAKINATENDAEEKPNGTVNLTSSDLELAEEYQNQIIGLRFEGLHIPQGAVISSADIQFTVDEAKNVSPCELKIYGRAKWKPGTVYNKQWKYQWQNQNEYLSILDARRMASS